MSPVSAIPGRTSATLALIYPPDMGVVVPGDRRDAHAGPMRQYRGAVEESFNRFAGFTCEVQCVFQQRVDGRIRFHTCAVRAYPRAGEPASWQPRLTRSR